MDQTACNYGERKDLTSEKTLCNDVEEETKGNKGPSRQDA